MTTRRVFSALDLFIVLALRATAKRQCALHGSRARAEASYEVLPALVPLELESEVSDSVCEDSFS